MKLIGIDVGHSENTWENTGGKGVKKSDGTVFEEYHYNLAVAKKLKELLLSDGRFQTYEAQPLDNTTNEVKLGTRTKLYNDKHVDVIISLHANAHSNKSVKGHMVFHWDTSKNGKKLADLWDVNADILLNDTSDKNVLKCVKGTWTDFYIVHYTYAPCILLEHAFFTNEDDLKLLESEDFTTRSAFASYYTICDYYGYDYKTEYGEEVEDLTWEEILKGCLDSPESNIAGVNAIKALAELDCDLGDLETFKFIDSLIEKVYKYGLNK